MTARKRILFLINPVSGSSPGPVLEARIRNALSAAGVGPDQYDTVFTSPEISSQVKELAPGYEIVVGVGGDGTFGGIMQAAARMENVPKLGIIPYGVGNDLARSLGMFPILKTKGVHETLGVILRGKTKKVDVLEVSGDSLFAGYFGAGNDALTSNTFNRLRPRAFKPAAGVRILVNNALYGLLAVRNLVYTIPFSFQLKYTDKRGNYKVYNVPADIHGILITNTSIYAGGAIISSKTDMSDGFFEVTIIRKLAEWWSMHFTRFFRCPLDVLCPNVIQFQTDSLQVVLDGKTFYQLDGEKPGQSVSIKNVLDFRIIGQVEMIVP